MLHKGFIVFHDDDCLCDHAKAFRAYNETVLACPYSQFQRGFYKHKDKIQNAASDLHKQLLKGMRVSKYTLGIPDLKSPVI